MSRTHTSLTILVADMHADYEGPSIKSCFTDLSIKDISKIPQLQHDQLMRT